MTAYSTNFRSEAPLASPGIVVRPMTDDDEWHWEAFVAHSPDTSFFHRAGWRWIIESTLGHRPFYRCAWRGSELVGILPLIHVRSPLFGNALISMAFGTYGGIAARDDEAARALADDAALLGESLAVDFVELRHDARQNLPGYLDKPELYFTFRRPIANSEELNLKAIPQKKRADLRKAIKNKELRCEVGPDIDTFFNIYAESVHNLGTPVLPKRFYAAIVKEFGPSVEISVIEGPSGPIAAMMTYYFKDRVLPYYSGANFAARKLHAFDLNYWRLIERALARGCNVYDFGRSKRGTGAFDYKTYWGFEPESLNYQVHLVRGKKMPAINPLNPKYHLMVEAWKRLPLPVANFIGPMIARQIA
jgi:FemAB-related protein (PEP-CTERM system-associated)